MNSRPLKSNLENANAAKIVVVTVPTIDKRPTMIVFPMYLAKLNCVSATLKFTHCISDIPINILGVTA